MTNFGAYFALTVFPVLYWTTPEPVSFMWGLKHGKLGVPTPPLPVLLKKRSERNIRYLRLAQYSVLGGCIFFLMRKYSLKAAVVGLHFHHWPKFLLGGLAAAFIWICTTTVVGRLSGKQALERARYEFRPELAGGPKVLVVSITLAGCFVEELWRAFCIIGLDQLGHSLLFIALATAVAFAIAHYGGGPTALEFGRVSGHATFGVVAAILFFWSHSLVATYAAHLPGNLVAIYRLRKDAGEMDVKP